MVHTRVIRKNKFSPRERERERERERVLTVLWGKIWIEWVEEELKYKKRGRKYNGEVVGDKEVKKKGKG